MSSNTLKITLAMGGGVSLGVFSGAALIESLKLLLIYGKDKDGNPYDDIVIDGMSGASAGAIALTIMLKSLIDYETMINVYNRHANNSEPKISKVTLLKELISDYFKNDPSLLPESKKEALLALQLSQKIQHQIWTQRLDSVQLFKKVSGKSIHSSFGLLNRKLLEKLAREYLLSPDNFDISKKQLLDPDRVVFACSITNMLPLEISISEEEENQLTKLQKNVLKSTGSENHSEIRVIDFIFNNDKVASSDSRWFKFYEGAQDEEMDLDITKNKAWSILTASALACGAFPIAFEPVLLKRYKKEYHKDNWPKAFEEIKAEIEANNAYDKSFFNEPGENVIDYESFNFPYIDGGTFNNEPIKEAFKIGTFQDFGNEASDRLILFVDPAVRQDKYHSFNVDSYNPIKNSTDKKVAAKGQFGKLINNISGIVGLLANQGSIKEEHRIKDAKQNLALKNELIGFIDQAKIGDTLKLDLIKKAFLKVHKNLQKGTISIGTRDIVVYFQNELKASCLTSGIDCILVDPNILKAIKNGVLDGSITSETDVYNLFNTGITDENQKAERINIFAQTIFRIIADFSLDTVGKNQNAELMSVLPIEKNGLNTIELPGDEVAAFGGFASLEARLYSFEYGKLSALVSLKEQTEGFRKPDESPIISDPQLDDLENQFVTTLKNERFFKPEYKYADDINNKLYQLAFERIKSMFPRLLNFAMKPMIGFTGILVGIVSPLSVFATKFNSINSLIRKALRKVADDINYKKLIPVTISILSKDKISNKIFVYPSNGNRRKVIKMYRNEIKNQKGELLHYQYLFNLYIIEYPKENELGAYSSKESNTYHKVASADISEIGLSFHSKVKNPSIDGNIDIEGYRAQLEAYSNQITIQKVTHRSKSLGHILGDINNPNFSLFYSLKNIDYHVNPMLEYNLDDTNSTWYFKENTKAFYLNL